MGHSHSHAVRNLSVAFFVNLVFVGIEVAGGLWTNSIAILTDALHDAGDCLALGLAWYLQYLSQRESDARFTYGYRRFSSLGALTTGVVLIVGLGAVAWGASQRLADPQPVRAGGMLVLAILGMAMNGGAAWLLRGGSSLNEKVASWHLLEDMLGWMAVLIGSIVMMATDFYLIDPLLAICIALFVLWNVVRNLFYVGHVFLQGSPHGFDAAEFDKKMLAIPGVISAHHTHTWSLDGERHVFSTHVVMQEGTSRAEIVAAKQTVHAMLRSQHFAHVTIEVELVGEPCLGHDDHDDEHDHDHSDGHKH
jgi:cobalt-zinc-cadmium efflux system protein